MSFFDIENIAFELMGYSMSYLEFIGTIAGYIAVVLSARANVWSWPIGVTNVVLFFFLFYQVQLYPDMFLQVFFFITNLIGWWRWTHPRQHEKDRKHELRITYMKKRQWYVVAGLGFTGTVLMGSLARNLHELAPTLFSKPSAFPYLDSFVTVVSIITTYYIIQKKVESWIMWIVVDAIATYMYFLKNIRFVSLQYLIFCFIAAYGLWKWMKEYRGYAG